MSKISHRKKWNVGVVEQHVEPPLIPLIKINHHDKSEKDFVKLKSRRDRTSKKSDHYELEIALLGNGNMEGFLMLVTNFNMTLESSGRMETATKAENLRTHVRGEVFWQFVLL